VNGTPLPTHLGNHQGLIAPPQGSPTNAIVAHDHGVQMTVGDVDTAAMGYDPTTYLTTFDYGTASTLPDGRLALAMWARAGMGATRQLAHAVPAAARCTPESVFLSRCACACVPVGKVLTAGFTAMGKLAGNGPNIQLWLRRDCPHCQRCRGGSASTARWSG